MNSHELSEIKGNLVIKTNDNLFAPHSESVDIPPSLVDAVVKGIQNTTLQSQVTEAGKEAAVDLFKVVLRPDLKQGIESGKLVWDGCSVDLRHASNNKFAGKIKLEKADLPTESAPSAKQSKPTAVLSNITQSICSLSGQMQLAEISKKIDNLDKKITALYEESWMERLSELRALTDTIEEARKLLPDNYAMLRINNEIKNVDKIAKFFESSIEAEISKKISLNLWESFRESFLTWFGKYQDEYNNEYISKINELLGSYSFLLDCYMHAETLLGVCYQIIHGYEIARKYYDKVQVVASESSNILYKKLLYLCEIKVNRFDTDNTVADILPLIENRKIRINQEITTANDAALNCKECSRRMKEQFELAQPEIEFLLTREAVINPKEDQ